MSSSLESFRKHERGEDEAYRGSSTILIVPAVPHFPSLASIRRPPDITHEVQHLGTLADRYYAKQEEGEGAVLWSDGQSELLPEMQVRYTVLQAVLGSTNRTLVFASCW